MGVEGWVNAGLAALAVIGVAVSLHCRRRGRAAADSGVALAAYAAAVATAAQLEGGQWQGGVARAIEAGVTTGRGEGRVHVGLPRHRVVSKEEAERKAKAEAEGRGGGQEGRGGQEGQECGGPGGPEAIGVAVTPWPLRA